MVAISGVLLTVMEKPPHLFEWLALLLAMPRLHDVGRSGWWVGGALIAEIVLVILALALLPSIDDALIAGGVFVMVILCLMIWLGCIPGDPQPNAYGKPPPSGYSWKNYKYTAPARAINTGADQFDEKTD